MENRHPDVRMRAGESQRRRAAMRKRASKSFEIRSMIQNSAAFGRRHAIRIPPRVQRTRHYSSRARRRTRSSWSPWGLVRRFTLRRAIQPGMVLACIPACVILTILLKSVTNDLAALRHPTPVASVDDRPADVPKQTTIVPLTAVVPLPQPPLAELEQIANRVQSRQGPAVRTEADAVAAGKKPIQNQAAVPLNPQQPAEDETEFKR